MKRPPTIDVEIGELVLHGFSPAQGHALSESIVGELRGLLARDGWPGRSPVPITRETVTLAGPVFSSKTELAGAQIARAIYGGLRA